MERIIIPSTMGETMCEVLYTNLQYPKLYSLDEYVLLLNKTTQQLKLVKRYSTTVGSTTTSVSDVWKHPDWMALFAYRMADFKKVLIEKLLKHEPTVIRENFHFRNTKVTSKFFTTELWLLFKFIIIETSDRLVAKDKLFHLGNLTMDLHSGHIKCGLHESHNDQVYIH